MSKTENTKKTESTRKESSTKKSESAKGSQPAKPAKGGGGTYDFVKERPPKKTTNVIESIGHLVKSCLGGGIVAIHEAYKNCGLWTAFILSVFLGFSVAYCMYMLVNAAQKMYVRSRTPAMSYPDLAEKSIQYGPWEKLKKYDKVFRYMVDGVIGIDLFGSCCVYQIVISKTIVQLVQKTDKVTDNDAIRLYLACLLIPCILICLITSLKYLAPFSIVADIFLVVVVGSTVFYALANDAKTPLDQMPIYKNASGLLEFLGVCVFSVEGVGAVLPVENSMTEPHKMPLVIIGGMTIVVSMVMIAGFFGYWGFGEDAASPVTVNFPFNTFAITLKVFMALMMYATFALNFWIPFNLMWVYIARKYPQDKLWLWERVYRTIFVCVITLIAIALPAVAKFMGVLGSFCLSNMGFIYPAFIELSMNWEEPGLGFMKWRLVKAILIIAFGILLCITGTVSNVKQLLNEIYGKK